jgi:nitroimidazol reductase NimA-like FMN-containing flavoprotein (pyridoxamine 5'-phosphate oxidase superfamily)
MLIQDMTREMSEDLLKRTHVGRLRCAQGSQPYVVPISFAYYRGRRWFLQAQELF